MTCERAIDCDKVVAHISKDLSLVEVPEDLPSVLQSAYSLVSYSNIVYNPGPIIPVFGIPLHENPLFFCDCGKGYSKLDSLRIHQTRQENRPCRLRQNSPGHHRGYGQRLAGNCSFFEVDINAWQKRVLDDDEDIPYSFVYRQTFPPPRQYSKMEIKGAEDEMNTSSFFFREGWLGHVEGYKPEDILEVCKASTSEVAYGDLLRKVMLALFVEMDKELRKHSYFGLPSLMGQTTTRETNHRYSPVSYKTLQSYSLTFHRLVFGILRQLEDSYPHKYLYPPLHILQLDPLRALKEGLVSEYSMDELIKLLRAACFPLIAHHQHQYETSRDLNQFFSPVICFLVLYSVREQGGFDASGDITQYIAHVMFGARGVILLEVKDTAKRLGIGMSE